MKKKKWCDRCPQEVNSCEECKNTKVVPLEKVPKVNREQKKRPKAKSKLIKK